MADYFGRFGSREICDVTFRPLEAVDICGVHFDEMSPCLFMDTATASTVESTATSVYARGGRGNPKLITWDGEKELTFTVTDALLSPVSFGMLSGATSSVTNKTYVHMTYETRVDSDKKVTVVLADLPAGCTPAFAAEATSKTYPTYAVILNKAGGVKHYCPAAFEGAMTLSSDKKSYSTLMSYFDDAGEVEVDDIVRLDFYVQRTHTEYEITPDKFAGYYYVEAETLYRDEATGADFPAVLILPRVKIQTQFTISMSNTGDPSTFDFVMDAMPGYTRDGNNKVLMTMQLLDPSSAEAHDYTTDAYGHDSNTFTSPTEENDTTTNKKS